MIDDIMCCDNAKCDFMGIRDKCVDWSGCSEACPKCGSTVTPLCGEEDEV